MIGNNTPACTFNASPVGETAAYNLSNLLQTNRFQPNHELSVGEIVSGRYRILSKIGQGGMGIVYQVEQVFLNKILALKTLDAGCNSETAVRRFQIEARTAFAIDHPNLISVHDFGLLEDKTPFLVMDYIQGSTLAERLSQDGTIHFEEAIPLFVRICFGLSYAHGKGVIHRDIKPSNIMLVDGLDNDDDDRVRIVDFGIAKFTQVEKSQIQALTRTGEVFGSPLYMSPEQCMGNPVDQRADIYSLGCVFFEALTGTPPFVGANALSTMMQHLGEKPPTLKEASMGRDFPFELEQIVARMLAKDGEDRYQNMGLVTRDLGMLLQEQKVDVSVVSPKATHSKSLKFSRSNNAGKTFSVSFVQLCGIVASTALLAAVATGFSLKAVDSNSNSASHDLFIKPASAIQAEQNSLALTHPLGMSVFTPLYELISQERFDDKLLMSRQKKKFKLRAVKLPVGAFEALSREKNIRNLDLMGCLLDSSKIGFLKGITDLEHLTLSQTNLTDDAVPELVKLSSVNDLEVSWTYLSSAGISKLFAMPKLARLEMSGMTVTDQVLKAAANSKSLKSVSLRSTKGLTDLNICLLENSKLEAINIESTGISDEGLKVLAKMPKLSFVSLGRSKVTMTGIANLLSLRRLRTLYYEESTTITERDMAKLAIKYPQVRFCNVLKSDQSFD